MIVQSHAVAPLQVSYHTPLVAGLREEKRREEKESGRSEGAGNTHKIQQREREKERTASNRSSRCRATNSTSYNTKQRHKTHKTKYQGCTWVLGAGAAQPYLETQS